MKRVAYLFGAGVTQAETLFGGLELKVLTSQIKDGIQILLERESPELRVLISNDLSVPDVDIEQLISLYESTGTTNDAKAAHFLRRGFMNELLGRLSAADESSAFQPKLMIGLFDLHKSSSVEINEVLAGVLTLNYDDYAERALEAVYLGFDAGFTIGPINRGLSISGGEQVPLLKLHGSFGWSNEFPPSRISIHASNIENCLWIPPGVDKKKERYPFNILWGRAKEMLNCDVLRIVGCSLSRNDWQLITLLHSAKRVTGLTIEYIDFHDEGLKKKHEYPYLEIMTILEIDGFKKHLSDQLSISESKQQVEEFASSDNAAQFNPFLEWLRFRKKMLGGGNEAVIGRQKPVGKSQYISTV